MSLLNYIKQIWDTTSYVNPTRMNHIEDGIYAVSDKVDNNLDDTEVKHGNTTVNAELNRIAPISLGSVSSGVTKQLTIPDNIFAEYGMYLLTVHNWYGAGSVYILRVNTSNDTMFFATLSNSTYFTVTAVDKKNFTVSASGASANDVTIMAI